jgi:hypothetical protein
VAHHAETSAVVDNEQVGAASLYEFGGDSRAGACGNEGFALGESCAQTVDDFLACVWVSFTGPWIGHKRWRSDVVKNWYASLKHLWIVGYGLDPLAHVKKYNPGFTHPCIITGDAWDKR